MPAEAAEEVDQPAAEVVVEEAVGQVEQVEQVEGATQLDAELSLFRS